MEGWPSTIPLPSLNLNTGATNSVLRSKGATGPFLQRRRYRAQQRLLQVSWHLSNAEFELLQTLFLYTLHGGADPFTISLPMGGTTGLSTTTCQFLEGSWNATHRDLLYWTVTATLVVNSPPIMTEAAYDALVA